MLGVRGLRRLRRLLLISIPAAWSVLPSLFRAPYQPMYTWLSDTRPVGGRVAVFVHFDPRGEVADRVLATLQALQAAGLSVLFVSNAGALQPAALTALQSVCAAILVRRNVGYDFGALREALAFWQLPHPQTEMVLLMNDSVLGPLRPLAEVLAGVDFAVADIWGATDSAQRGEHLQSWFLAVGPRALRSPAWAAFWAGVRPVLNKEYVVSRSELAFSQAMRRGGLTLRALWPERNLMQGVFAGPRAFSGLDELRQLARIRRYGNLGYALNPTADLWRQLLQAGCPFIKRELIERNPARVADVADWRTVVDAYGRTGASDLVMIAASRAAADMKELNMRQALRLTALLASLCLGACSSSFGGGGDPPPTKVLVLPQGQAVVCPNGTAPPC